MALAQTIQIIEERKIPDQFKMISVQELPELEGREYRMIDFILPGMLGFSLLSAAVFGVALCFLIYGRPWCSKDFLPRRSTGKILYSVKALAG